MFAINIHAPCSGYIYVNLTKASEFDSKLFIKLFFAFVHFFCTLTYCKISVLQKKKKKKKKTVTK